MNKTQKDIINILNIYLHKNNTYDFSNSNWDDIYVVSNKLGLGYIVSYVVNKYKLIDNKIIYEKELYKAARYVELLNNYRDQIKELLEKNNVDFLFLKGNTLSKYYEEDYLRFSTDIDIIVKNKDFNIARAILLDNLGLKESKFSTNEITLTNNVVSIDLHLKFTEVEEVQNLYDEVTYSNNHELTNEYKYIFSIEHAVKHIKANYIPIQFLLDLYYLRKLNLDENYINSKLEKYNLLTFNEQTIKLINCLFNGKELDEKTNRYLEFVMNEQTIENEVLVGKTKNKNYLTKRLFPSYKEMCRLYPILLSKKILLPKYYVKRIIDRTRQGHLQKAIEEINVNMDIDKNKLNETKILLKDLGL